MKKPVACSQVMWGPVLIYSWHIPSPTLAPLLPQSYQLIQFAFYSVDVLQSKLATARLNIVVGPVETWKFSRLMLLFFSIVVFGIAAFFVVSKAKARLPIWRKSRSPLPTCRCTWAPGYRPSRLQSARIANGCVIYPGLVMSPTTSHPRAAPGVERDMLVAVNLS